MTGAGKGRPAGMAILDAEVQRVLEEPVPQPVPSLGERGDVADHTVGLTRVRRHGLRRLLVADVVGLAIAALLGPLLVSAVSANPASTASRSGKIYLFDLAVIPMFIAVFALYGLYRGVTRRISMSVFSDLRNIVHALMISGFLYAIIAYATRKNSDLAALTVGKVAAMCLVAVIAVPLAGWWPSGCSPGSVGRSGHRGRYRKAGPDRGQPPPGPLQRAASSGSSTTTPSGATTCWASSRTSPSCAGSTGWPGWWCASPAPTPSAPPRC